MSFGLAFGLIIFLLMGTFYGVKSTDVSGGRLFLLSLAGNLMSFTIFGVLFTLIWLIALLFGVNLSIEDFHLALLLMVLTGVGGFFAGFFFGKVTKPDHREVV